MKRTLHRYAVESFIVLTLGLTFAAYLLPLPSESKPILFPLLLTFIPALVATGLAAVAGGGALKALYGSLRVGKPGWLGIAVLVGAGMQAAITILAFLLGYVATVRLVASPQLVALAFLTPLLALGEELGWRAYALPRLLENRSRLAASLITGVPWALVHLALFLPGMMFVGRPILAQVAPVALFSILHAWVFIKSGGSVLAPTLLHGTFNFMGAMINSELGVQAATYLGAIVLVSAAVILVAAKPALWLNKESLLTGSGQPASQ